MSSGTSIIQKALQRIQAHSVAKPAAPETIENGRDALNSMLEVWKSNYIEIGTMPLDAPGDELSEPVDTRNAIVDCLAIYMAADMNRTPSIELKASASKGFDNVKKHYQIIPIPKKVLSSVMPLGAGNSQYLQSAIFAGEDFEVDG